MGFTFIPPTVVGGTVLIIERIQSQNYVPGSAGWAISADGDAEFANLVARGTFISGNGTGPHIEILSAIANQISFYGGDPAETAPGDIFSASDLLSIQPPTLGATSHVPSLQLQTDPATSRATIFADVIELDGSILNVGGTTIGLVGSKVSAMRYGNTSAVTNASSQLVIPHGLGVAPAAVLLGPQSHYARVQAVGVANITVEFRNPAGGALVPATLVSLYWQAIA